MDRGFSTVAAVICAIAIATIPVFSYQSDSSRLPQLFAVLAVGAAAATVLLRLPGIHPAMIAYVALVAFWSFTVVEKPAYFTLLKVTILALAAHVIFRTPRQLLLLLGTFSVAGAITFIMNMGDITNLRSSLAGGDALRDSQRLSGTFGNANTAGRYAVMIALFAVIVFFNSRSRFRWPLLASGVLTGVIIGALSGSRTCMIGMLVVAMAAPLLAMAGERAQLLKWAKGMVIGLVALGAALAVLSQLPFLERLTRLAEGSEGFDKSAEVRYDMAFAAYDLWRANPLAGVGHEGFRFHSGFGTYSHTTFLEVLANGGLIGFSLIAFFYLFPPCQLIALLRLHPQPEIRRLSMGFLGIWGVFFVYSLFGITHDSRDLIPLYAAICGFIHEHKRRPRSLDHRREPPNVLSERFRSRELRAGTPCQHENEP